MNELLMPFHIFSAFNEVLVFSVGLYLDFCETVLNYISEENIAPYTSLLVTD